MVLANNSHLSGYFLCDLPNHWRWNTRNSSHCIFNNCRCRIRCKQVGASCATPTVNKLILFFFFRASAFFLMALASFIGNLLGPLISSRLMETYSPWVPLTIALFLIAIGTSLIFFVPETLKIKPGSDDGTAEETQSFTANVLSHLKHTFGQLLESFTMLKSPSLTIILLTFLIQMPLHTGKTTFFIQYFSK